MPPVKIIIAVDDLSIHQVIQDILEITFKETKTERVMSAEALFGRLREKPGEYNLLLVDSQFDIGSPTAPVTVLRSEFPGIIKHTVLIVAKSRQFNARPEWQGLARVVFPFVIDEFAATVRDVYEKARDTDDGNPASTPDGNSL
jgi:hypothetical protein